MKVEQAMKTSPISATPETPIREAVTLMAKNKVGSLLVVEGKKLVGIMTERDVLQKVVLASRDPSEIKVADVMSRNPITIDQDDTLEAAAEKLSKNKIKKLPVVKDGELVGIVTDTDIVERQPSMMKALSRTITFKERQIVKKKIKPVAMSFVALFVLLLTSMVAFMRILVPLVENNCISQGTLLLIFGMTVFLTVISVITIIVIYFNFLRKEY